MHIWDKSFWVTKSPYHWSCLTLKLIKSFYRSIKNSDAMIYPISVQFSRSVVSDSLQPHGLQHARPPCPSPTQSLLKLISIESVMLSNYLILCHPHPLLPLIIPLASGSFQMSQLFASGGQNIGVPASTSVLPMNIQDWFPLGWIGWISLQSKGLSRVFSNTTVQKYQCFSAQVSFWSNTNIHTWLLEKPYLWLDGPCWQSNVSAF